MPISKLIEIFGQRGMRLGLEMMNQLDALHGYPSKALPFIHVGGTNGKGSVTTKIAAVLQENGYKVGLYTSPHISTFRERITINGEMISEQEALAFLENIPGVVQKSDFMARSLPEFEPSEADAEAAQLKPVGRCRRVQKQGKGFDARNRFLNHERHMPKEASFFECMTILALHFFAKERCDVAVLEVGMGGRLDATNIVTPLLSVITSIGFDHSLYLGDTLEKIAFEKAGIIKPNVPLLVGPSCARFPIFREKASSYFEVQGPFSHFEEENREVARKALDLLPFKTTFRETLSKTPPCRFEFFESRVVLDVAHNPDGLEAVFKRLRKKPRVLFAIGKDKEIEPFLDLLIKNASFLHITEAKSPRACRAEDLGKMLEKKGFHQFVVEADVEKAFREAYRHKDDLLVTGTFYIMSEVRSLLGVKEPCDGSLVTPY